METSRKPMLVYGLVFNIFISFKIYKLIYFWTVFHYIWLIFFLQDSQTNRTLTLISKTIQSLGNLVSSRSSQQTFKEEYMVAVYRAFYTERHIEAVRQVSSSFFKGLLLWKVWSCLYREYRIITIKFIPVSWDNFCVIKSRSQETWFGCCS